MAWVLVGHKPLKMEHVGKRAQLWLGFFMGAYFSHAFLLRAWIEALSSSIGSRVMRESQK